MFKKSIVTLSVHMCTDKKNENYEKNNIFHMWLEDFSSGIQDYLNRININICLMRYGPHKPCALDVTAVGFNILTFALKKQVWFVFNV